MRILDRSYSYYFSRLIMEQYKEGQPVIEMQRDDEGRGAWLKLLIPQRGYFITPILIYLNFLVFAIMVLTGVHFMEPESVDLINWGATNRVLVLEVIIILLCPYWHYTSFVEYVCTVDDRGFARTIAWQLALFNCISGNWNCRKRYQYLLA